MSRNALATLDRAAGGLFPFSQPLSAEVGEVRDDVAKLIDAARGVVFAATKSNLDDLRAALAPFKSVNL
jgi:hypothetical protein